MSPFLEVIARGRFLRYLDDDLGDKRRLALVELDQGGQVSGGTTCEFAPGDRVVYRRYKAEANRAIPGSQPERWSSVDHEQGPVSTPPARLGSPS